MNRIVECNVWCVANTEDAINLGLPEGDSWMPFAVDFSCISAIKLSGESEFLGNDKATINFNGRDLTIDIPYKQAVAMWKKVLLNENASKDS